MHYCANLYLTASCYSSGRPEFGVRFQSVCYPSRTLSQALTIAPSSLAPRNSLYHPPSTPSSSSLFLLSATSSVNRPGTPLCCQHQPIMLRAAANLNVWKCCRAAYTEVTLALKAWLKLVHELQRCWIIDRGCMPERGGHFFCSHYCFVCAPRLHLAPSTGDQDHSYTSDGGCCCLYVFFYIHSQRDGHHCRRHFRMQCVCHALFIICFDIAPCSTSRHRDQKDAERKEALCCFPSHEIFCRILSLSPDDGLFAFWKVGVVFFLVQYIFLLYVHPFVVVKVKHLSEACYHTGGFCRSLLHSFYRWRDSFSLIKNVIIHPFIPSCNKRPLLFKGMASDGW